MSRHRSSISVIGLLISASSLIGQQPKYSPTPPIVQIPSDAKARAIAIFAPKPDYPKYARDRNWTGTGWFVMHVETKTGVVKWVEITQSTGHKILDDEVVKTFSRWKFEPGKAAPKVKSPITFSLPIEEKKSSS